MNEIDSRRQYTREFKLETVEFLLRGDKTGVEVASDLGIRVDLSRLASSRTGVPLEKRRFK